MSGTATLTNASLVVDWGSFTPLAGQAYTVMTFGSRGGTQFNSVTIPPVFGLSFTTSYSGTGVTISAGLLPVELTEFKASLRDDNTTFLNWKTESETNNKGFDIERSHDGQRWEKLGFAEGKGSTLTAQSYSFIDEKPTEGTNYYRLRQMDFDGDFDYSPIRSVERKSDGKSAPRIYPNPVSHGQLTLYFSNEINENSTLRLYSSAGQLLHKGVISEVNTSLDVSDLAAGIYLLEIMTGQKVWQERVIVK